jgi:hypothetical protein
MSPRFRLLLGATLVALAPAAALSCPNEAHTTATASPALRPHPRAAEIVAYRPHAWRPVSFAVAAPGAAGMVVSIDPVDGAMTVPAPGSLESSLVIPVGDDLTPVSIVHRADGSIRAQLDERWESHAVAAFGPDGKFRWTCVDGTRGAAQFMKQPVVPVVTSSAPVPEVK